MLLDFRPRSGFGAELAKSWIRIRIILFGSTVNRYRYITHNSVKNGRLVVNSLISGAVSKNDNKATLGFCLAFKSLDPYSENGSGSKRP